LLRPRDAFGTTRASASRAVRPADRARGRCRHGGVQMSRRSQAGLVVIVGAVLGAFAAVIGSAAHADVPWLVTVPAGLSAGILVAASVWLPAADPRAAPPRPPVPRTGSASSGGLAS